MDNGMDILDFYLSASMLVIFRICVVLSNGE